MFRFGILGTGNIAATFYDATTRTDCAEVIAVASRTPGKAQQFAEKTGGNFDRYGSYEELLKRPDIDGVYIATTHNFHFENMMLALSYGKHVMCEKSFVMTKREAEQVFSVAKEKNLFCMEAMWSRFLPAIKKAKEWIDAGLIGDVNLANFLIGFASSKDPNGRIRNPKLGGGAMYDISVYGIELTTYLIGKPVASHHSYVLRDENGVDMVNNITLCYPDCVANVQTTVTTNVGQFLNIYGTKGRISIADPHFADSCERYDENGLAEKVFFRRDNGFQYQIEEMVRCVNEGKLESDVIPHADTIFCASIFDSMNESK